MGLLYDLTQLNYNKLKIKDLNELHKRGACPILNSGKLVGFTDKEGTILVIYK